MYEERNGRPDVSLHALAPTIQHVCLIACVSDVTLTSSQMLDLPPTHSHNTSVDGFRVARTQGTTRRTQRFERRGLNV
jgi:hypothetical protein